MSGAFALVVTDTSPLITLAMAGELDLLLRPGIPVNIPDAVFNEATRVRTARGASAIVDWFNAHLDQVHIVPTEVGIDQQRRLEEGRSTRGLGEAAALEAIERFLGADPEARALLLFEDSDVMRRRAIVEERVGLISTGDFLRELETAHLIQSTVFLTSLRRPAATWSGNARSRVTSPCAPPCGSSSGRGRVSVPRILITI